MDTISLKAFLRTHNSFERAKETFKVYADTWRKEEPEEFFEAFGDLAVDLMDDRLEIR